MKRGCLSYIIALGIGPTYSVSIIGLCENYINKKHFNLEHLYKIAFYLDVKVEVFLTGLDTRAF